jgi:ATP/maltotriose-dependent transcriptional regulator MalT
MASSFEQLSALVASRQWERVHEALSQVDCSAVSEMELLAEASWWLGRVNECIEIRQRVFECYERDGDLAGAARLALLLSEDHRRQAHRAVGESWLRRAERLLEDRPDCVDCGYLRLYQGERARRAGDLERARERLAEARAIADRLGDRDLAADVAQELGRVTILSGQPGDGLALMDEAMLAASEGRLDAYTTGKVYCCMMSACDELGDLERLTEWRKLATAWSSEHGVDVFPGMCRVHHADLLAHLGQWDEAEREAERACDELREVGWVVAFADVTIGEIRRRRGDLAGAAEAFRCAEGRGVSPETGRSMLLLAGGDAIGANRRISRALAERPTPALQRARLLPAQVEIAVAAHDTARAASAAVELEEIAAAYGTLKLRAEAVLARTRVHLAEGEWVDACTTGAAAVRLWQDLSGPYEVATARVLHARACRALDDLDGWATSLDAAAETFATLGAVGDLATVEHLRAGFHESLSNGQLTSREIEVLRLIATGATNKMIAAELVVSQKTVARHVSNIFTKIGVSSRAGATAYAYRYQLVGS